MNITPHSPVRDLMSAPVAKVGLGATLRYIAEELTGNWIGAVIVASDTQPVGIITERDVVAHVAAGAHVDHLRAEEILTSEMVTLTPSQTVLDAARAMAHAGVRHLPVVETVDDVEDVVGVVSVRDVLGVLVEALDQG